MVLVFSLNLDGTEEPKRKRKSRWAAEDEKVTIPGMPTALPTNMTEEQLEMFLRKCQDLLSLFVAFVVNAWCVSTSVKLMSSSHDCFVSVNNLVHTRLEEITKKLKSGDVLPLDRERYVPGS